MSNFKADCRKFQPNIFNKIKCSNCFRQREEHTAEALESNRASRRVSKCGYLFVAPDWDFSNPLNRTKRWQRRWFVLFDDGELTYSVDDLPATIPQGVIDMNRVLEVSEAEDVTGNQFALAITSPDRATFVKGTSREESRWWREVLSVFPRSHKQHGRYKRNATFPGIKSSSSVLQQSRSSLGRTPSPSLVQSFEGTPVQRVRFHSCASDSFSVGRPSSAPTLGGQGDVFPTKGDSPPSSPPSPLYHSTPMGALTPSNPRLLAGDEHKENTPPYIQDYDDNPPTSESPPTQDKVLGHRPRTRRTAKREARGLSHPRSELSHHLIIDLEETKRGEKLKDIADSLTRPRSTLSLAYLNKEISLGPDFGQNGGVKPTRDGGSSLETKASHATDDVTDPPIHDQIRGDPDGCGLNGENNRFNGGGDTPQRVELPAEDVLYMKKGWLMKQAYSQDWSKHWFVLEGTGLKFFRDPGAEDNGILDGIIDLGLVKDVQEKDVGRNYGFVVTTWDDKKFILCAVTSGIRSSWVQAMRNGANLREARERPLTLGERLEKEIGATQDSIMASVDDHLSPDLTDAPASTLCLHGSSSEDYKTASESSFFREISTDSVLEDRLTARSSSRSSASNQRSHSSPPVSRRATRDLASSPLDSDSVLELGKRLTPEKDSSGTIASTGEGMLVELLETQVESLKAKLEETQDKYLELHKENLSLRDRLSSKTSNKAPRLTSKNLSSSSDAKGRLIRDCNHDQSRQLSDLRSHMKKQEEEIQEKNKIISRIGIIRKQFQEERREWEERLVAEENTIKSLKASENKHGEMVRKLTRSLQETEIKVTTLKQELSKTQGARSSLNRRSEAETILKNENADLKKQVKEFTTEVGRLKESLKGEKSEVYKWKDLVKELRSLLNGRTEDMEIKREEVHALREKLRRTQKELDSTSDRLQRGIEENDALCERVRELESHMQVKGRRGSSNPPLTSSRERSSSKAIPRMDSLSDLTNIDLHLHPENLQKECLEEEYTELRIRFEKAVGEIRALKKEVRGAESLQDDMELTNQRLKSDLKAQRNDFQAQMQLMSTRVEDLTAKLNNSEKQVRTLRQKMTRTESRDRRRSLSLKGKESPAVSKDLEAKLSQLEAQVAALLNEEDGRSTIPRERRTSEARRSKSFEEALRKTRLRRKSLDGQVTEEDAISAALRVNALEERVSSLAGKELKKSSTTSLSSSSGSVPCRVAEVSSSLSHSNNLQVSSRSKSPAVSPLRSPASSRRNSCTRSPKLSLDKLGKLSRTESEPKLLREKINNLETTLSTIQSTLGECQTCVKALECACACRVGSDTLPRLQELLGTASHLSQHYHTQCNQAAVRRARPLALRLQDLLKEKAAQLGQRRQQLRAAGKWTREAQLKSLAERLSFEAVLLSQVAQALQVRRDSGALQGSLRLQELIEAHRKLTFLEKKLSDPEFDMEPLAPLEFYSSLLAEKLALEGDVLESLMVGSGAHGVAKGGGSSSPPGALSETCKELLAKVLEREQRLTGEVARYKEEKLREVALLMARDGSGSQGHEDSGDGVLPEESRLREAWAMAQDILTQEVANLEASQSVLRLAHLVGLPQEEEEACLGAHTSAVSLERLLAVAEDSLRQEMEESVFTLSRKYEDALREDVPPITPRGQDLEVVLGEFAAVLAQKALIDGQLAIATGDPPPSAITPPAESSPTIVEPLEVAEDVAASEAHLLMFLGGGGGDVGLEGRVQTSLTRAEFAFLFSKMTTEASDVINGFVSDHKAEMDAPEGHSKIPPSSPKSSRRRSAPGDTLPAGAGRFGIIGRSRRASDITGMLEASSCRQCEDLRQEVARLRRVADGRRLRRHDADCKKCAEYLQTLQTVREEHRSAMEALQSQHRAEIDRLRDQVKYDPPTRDSDDELTELKRRLCLLEEGYEAQIAALKKQYTEALGSQSDICEENTRQRYQLEIERLRELCEKGLTAMESSHRRLLSEMEEKHRREMEQLRTDKEEALAEETQATLAALDAMRKAHEAEVQKEVTKFKEEFARRAGAGPEGEATYARLHEQEVREVQREILTLSEKYSGKCLETAAKDQKLESLQRQLAEAKAQARALEERNRLLKQRLNGHLTHLQQELVSSSDQSPADLQHQFECQLTLKDEEIADLNQMLLKSKMHESDLGTLCGHLGQFLKNEKSLRAEEATMIRGKLESRIKTAVGLKDLDGGSRKRGQRLAAGDGSRPSLGPKSRAKREVSRSPSCPGLSGFSPLLSKGTRESSGRAPSPLLGMVAQRKKVFEGAPITKYEC